MRFSSHRWAAGALLAALLAMPRNVHASMFNLKSAVEVQPEGEGEG